MLQALKKLESRSAWPVAASKPLASAPRAAAPATRIDPPLALLGAAPSIVVEPLPSYLAVLSQNSAFSPVFVAESPRLEPAQLSQKPTHTEKADPAPAKSAPQPAPVVAASCAVVAAQNGSLVQSTAKPPRSCSRLERAVSRALADPLRGEPYRQAAERLVEGAQEISGRTLVLAGVGSASDTHDLTLHLAAALANEGRTLVVEGDLSRRVLADELGLADARGLGDALRGECALTDAVVPTTLDGVSILPAGRSGLILTSTVAQKLPEMFDLLAADYKYLLIDGGRTDDPGAALLARAADAAYFVVRLGATDAGQAQAALRSFRAASARVLGCIATS
jgi:Mrp family chromosome partitioning ATPase